MIIYRMHCPIHKGNTMSTDKLVPRKGSAKKEPLFECKLCKKYYLYDTGTPGRKIGTYGDKEVIACKEKYTLDSDVYQRTGNSIFKPTSVDVTSSLWGNTSVRSRTIEKRHDDTDITVRIKRIHDSEVTKTKNNLSNIRNEYPSIATDRMSVFDFMMKVCGSGVERSCLVRNTSLMWKGTLVKKVEFCVKDSQYLKTRMPAGIYISFSGKISNGEFVVDEMRVIEDPSDSEGWKRQNLKFAYDGEKHSNWFYNITSAPAEPSKKLSGELALWNEYLDWKRQLSEYKIKGVKYIAFNIDIEERKMTALAVSEGPELDKEFRKFLSRNEISIFSNNYSKNRWEFDFNREYQDTQDSGIDAVFVEYGERYKDLSELKSSSWSYKNNVTKKYKDDKIDSFEKKLAEIGRSYFEPSFHELCFELTERAFKLIKRDMRKNGAITESTEKSILEDFYSDGYLATTQIGDFTLLNRLKRAIDDLANGKSAQKALDMWLFNIKNANSASKLEKVGVWQNTNINEKQKHAVEKIISAPDVCLIQGPPGTGKTTVIAEAIYQFVIRNKRVLVASQANLAVDNALERLIANPKIRAIRLGNEKKIDDSVKNITEDNVLETFYDSIVDYIQDRYLDKWEEADEVTVKCKRDYAYFKELNTHIDRLEEEIENTKEEIESLTGDSDLAARERFLEIEKDSLSSIINSFKESTGLPEVHLENEVLVELWKNISDHIMNLNKGGVVLTKVGIDVNNWSSMNNTEANRLVKNILVKASSAIKLSNKVSSDTQFGGESEEIENLRLQEQELREKMMTDANVVAEWQAVNKKIKELSQKGIVLDENERSIFKNIDSVEDSKRRAFIIAILDATRSEIERLIDSVCKCCNAVQKEVDSELSDIAAKRAEDENEIKTKQNDITRFEEELASNRDRQNAITEKYGATVETTLDCIAQFARKRKEELQTSCDRGSWEEIFTGLRDWVADIPDYSQEKDIFLRDFINGCNVVGVSCTENTRTLSENGFDDFDVVIIDEVSKATPPELLIPMLRGRKIVLVGDHRQLPPLFNEHEKSYEELAKQQEDDDDAIVSLTMEDFEKYKDMVTASLFERYFETADPSIKETLTIQYRMHSDIMDLINLFYDGYLQDGNEDEYTEDTKAHYLSICSNYGTEMIVPDKHAYWFDSSQLAGERIFEFHKAQSSSCQNSVEAETIIELLKKMENQYANMERIKDPVSVGVISFYYDQVSLIKKMIKRESFHAIDVEVNTVDRFQGKEKQIIFVSLVRNVKNPKHNLDSYIAAFQRINVAFSRAQNLLIILGATDMYSDQPVKLTDMNNGEEKVIYPYREILEMMNSRGTYFTCDEVIPESRVDEILINIAKQGEEDK